MLTEEYVCGVALNTQIIFLPVFTVVRYCLSLRGELYASVDQCQVADAQPTVGRVCALKRRDVILVSVGHTHAGLHQCLTKDIVVSSAFYMLNVAVDSSMTSKITR